MQDIDRAIKAQDWLMKYYRYWIPLDACLELVRVTQEITEVEGVDNLCDQLLEDIAGSPGGD